MRHDRLPLTRGGCTLAGLAAAGSPLEERAASVCSSPGRKAGFYRAG